MLAYTGRNGVQAKAQATLADAVRDGVLERPWGCERCGALPEHRLAIQAHHTDYRQPLEVEWLCIECHEGEHEDLRTRGELIPY